MTARGELDRIIQQDLEQFNRMLRDTDLGGIFARPQPPKVPGALGGRKVLITDRGR